MNMSTHDQFVFNSTQYLHARGLPSNSFSINGKYVRALVCTNVRAMGDVLFSFFLHPLLTTSPLSAAFDLTLLSSSRYPLPYPPYLSSPPSPLYPLTFPSFPLLYSSLSLIVLSPFIAVTCSMTLF